MFPEIEDMGFKDHLDRQHETDMYLAKGLDFAATFNLNNNGNRTYGWNPTVKNIAFGLRLAVHYFTETITITNDAGEEIKILGLLVENEGSYRVTDGYAPSEIALCLRAYFKESTDYKDKQEFGNV
mgnify:CR=1 FL=1